MAGCARVEGSSVCSSQVVTAARDELDGSLAAERGKNADLSERNRGLNASVDKLSRAQHEMLQRAKKVRCGWEGFGWAGWVGACRGAEAARAPAGASSARPALPAPPPM